MGGPLAIAVDATPFQSYHGGIMQNPSCSKTRLDHAINIVGYGSASVPYWKIRNSWGTSWGEAGYIRLFRGDCTCGVCTQVVSATGVSISNSPVPPGPSPSPPPPSDCHDKYHCVSVTPYDCRYVQNVVDYCKKTCGCCVPNPPDYCYTSAQSSPQSIFDEIKKFVCQYVANGTAEQKAEQFICSQFSQVAICDQIVKILWSELEDVCTP